MGNRVRADISIGGRLNACCVPAFLEELEDEDLSVRAPYSATGDYQRPASPEELLELLMNLDQEARKAGARPGPLTVGDDEVNYANLDGVQHFCRTRGLPYHYSCDDGGGEWDAEDDWWTPRDGNTMLLQLVSSGSAVSLNDLRTSWKDKTGAEIAAHYDARTVEPPPLELVDVPQGQACPGCLADALLPGSSLPQDFADPAGPALDPEGTEAA